MTPNERRLFDWRFLVALGLLLIGCFLMLSMFTTVADNKAKGDRIDTLVAQLQKERDASIRADDQAAVQRKLLLKQQNRLLELYDSLDERQTRLLLYLRREGIDIPVRFIAGQGGGGSDRDRSLDRRHNGGGPETGHGKKIPGKAKGLKGGKRPGRGERMRP